MILSHRAPSSLNMSSYRAIWTHFRPNSMIFINLIHQKTHTRTSNLLAPVSSTLRKAEDFMPGDIRSSYPRHWMVFGQLVMPVQCCAGAPAAVAKMTQCLLASSLLLLRVFKMVSWMHDGSLDSRWVPGFTMGSWIHDGFLVLCTARHSTEIFGTARIISCLLYTSPSPRDVEESRMPSSA